MNGSAPDFVGRVARLRTLMEGSASWRNQRRVGEAKGELAAAWNGLPLPLKLAAQIAAAGAIAPKDILLVVDEKDGGVIGSNGEGAEKFHDPYVSIAAAVRPNGPLGTVVLFHIAMDIRGWREKLDPERIHSIALGAARDGDAVELAQLFFASALMLSWEWKSPTPSGDWAPPDSLSERLIQAAEVLYRVGERSPKNLYLDDVIGLRRVAVQLSPNALKGVRLAALQEAVAQSLEPSQRIKSAFYWLYAAANWNNARSSARNKDPDEEVAAPLRAFDRAKNLLQLAGRLKI